MTDNKSNNSMVVNKAHEYVHIANNISFTQRRMVNVLLWNARENLLSGERTHSISVAKLRDLMGFPSTNTQFIKDAFKSLMDIKFEWNILDSDEENWIAVTAISFAQIKGHECFYRYDSFMEEKLANPSIYARIDLRLLGAFKSNYALALYETVMRFHDDGVTDWIQLTLLHKLLGVPEGMTTYKYFKRDILLPAIKEVNEVSSIALEPDYKTLGRKVVAIRFTIEDKKQQALELVDVGNEFNKILLNELVRDYGLSETQAKELLTVKAEDDIREALRYVDEAQKKGDIRKSIPAFTFAAIKGSYKLATTKFDRKQQEVKVEIQKATELQQQEAALRSAFKKHQYDRVIELLDAMDEQDLKEYEHAFEASANPAVRTAYQKSGLKTKRGIAYNAFISYMLDKLLFEPSDTDFEVFVQVYGDRF